MTSVYSRLNANPINRLKTLPQVPIKLGMAVPRRTTQYPVTRRDGVHLCPECDSDLVQPIDWRERDRDNWAVELRCPECEWRGDGVFTQLQVDRFDRVLDAGARSLVDDLRRLTRDNMEGEVERFAEALHQGSILPEDF